MVPDLDLVGPVELQVRLRAANYYSAVADDFGQYLAYESCYYCLVVVAAASLEIFVAPFDWDLLASAIPAFDHAANRFAAASSGFRESRHCSTSSAAAVVAAVVAVC